MTGYFQAAPRPLRSGDEEPVRALVHAALGVTPYVDRVMELLETAERAAPESHALVVERDGTIAALALFGPVAGARGVWKLHTVLLAARVDPREVGTAVLNAVLERVRAAGARRITAELPADPAYGSTVSLLRASDFDQEGRIRDFYRDGVALLFLRRDL